VQIPTGGTARKPFARVARFGETPKPTVKKVLSFAVWMGKGASVKGSTDMMFQCVLGTIYVPPEEDSSGGFLFYLRYSVLPRERLVTQSVAPLYA